MTDPTTQSALDRLRRHQATEQESLQRSAAPSTSPEERLGLRFKPSDRVLDLATGRRGTVLAGRRSESTSEGVYEVKLVDGQTVVRLENELAKDQPPAPAPGR